MNKKTIATLAIAGSIGFTSLAAPATLVQATPTTEREFNQRINQLSEEQTEAEEQLEAVLSEITKTEEEAEELLKKVEETGHLLHELHIEIEELNEIIEQRESLLHSQARAVQVTADSGSIVRFLIESESLSDVISRLDVVTTLVSANQSLIQKQIDDKELVVDKEQETLVKQEEQTLLAAELENKKVELEEQSAEQEVLVASIAAERAEVEEEREKFLEEQRAAEQRRQEIQAARAAAREVTVLSSQEAAETEVQETASEDTVVSTSSSAAESTVSTQESSPAPTPAPAGGSVISIAHSLTGTPYSYGGTTPGGFDCSGFITYVFNKAGARSLPRTAAGMYSATTRISRSEAQPGDLIFFSQGGGIDHAGIYLGGGNFIGSQSSTGVAVASINSGYWSNYVAGFGR